MDENGWFGSEAAEFSCPWNAAGKRALFNQQDPVKDVERHTSLAADRSPELAGAIEEAVADGLRNKQRALYGRIAAGALRDSGTQGVWEAGRRVDGAKELLAAYGELGLPGALRRSAGLEELLRDKRDGQIDRSLVDREDVADFYLLRAEALGGVDPADDLKTNARKALAETAITPRRRALRSALRSAIAASATVDQSSPMVRATLQRLDLRHSLTAPTVGLDELVVNPDRRAISVTIRHPVSAAGAVRGRLVLTTPTPATLVEAVDGRTQVVLGSAPFEELQPGRTQTVPIAMDSVSRRVLASGPSHRVSVRAHVSDTTGESHTSVVVRSVEVPGATPRSLNRAPAALSTATP